MARIRIDCPAVFPFSTSIPIRITDLNYGGHVGNDTILSIIHEARMQFLQHYGYSEMNFGGVGIIMADAAIEFKQEVFYGDTVKVWVAIGDLSRVSFALYYKLEKETAGAQKIVALAKTGMVCYRYEEKKIAAVPDAIKLQFA